MKPHTTPERSIIPLDDHNFYVFWEDELEHYHVTLDLLDNLTCHGRSDGEKCWPFFQRAHCPHTARVEKHLRGDKVDVPLSPAQRFIAEGGSIADLWDYSTPPTHIPTRRERVKSGY